MIYGHAHGVRRDIGMFMMIIVEPASRWSGLLMIVLGKCA